MITLAIDLQACQSAGSSQRGVGRYVWSFCEALWPRLRGRQRLVILCSGHYPIPRRGWLLEALQSGEVELRVLEGLEAPTEAAARRRNSARYAAMLEGCDGVLIGSPFEEGPGLAVPDGRDGLENLRIWVILYDLIPLLFPDRYLTDPAESRHYYARLQLLREADGLLAISEATRQDAIHHLDVSPTRIHLIFGGVGAEFGPLGEPEQADAAATRAEHGIDVPFLLYTGGDDWRKNLDGLITAYARVPPASRQNHQLVIICRLTPASLERYQRLQRELGLAAREVVFTGFVPDMQLRHLYATALALVFPSHYEGFGLPVAEAMACGCPAVVADNSSLRELVTDPAARFDQSDADAMARILTRLLNAPEWRTELSDHARAMAPQLTWDRVAARASGPLLRQVAASPRCRRSKPRLALFAPIPPQASGIADYSAHLALQMARDFRITWVTDGLVHAVPETLAAAFDIVSVRDFEARADAYPHYLYQFGNSEFHLYQLPWLVRRPGTLVLHDVRLDDVAWLVDRQRSGGIASLYPSRSRATLRAALDAAPNPALRASLQGDALLWFAARASRRCVVHSDHARELLTHALAQSPPPLLRVPLGASAPRHPAGCAERRHLRQRWGIPVEHFVLGAYGVIAPPKGIDLLVAALVLLPERERAGLTVLLVGAAQNPEWLDGLLERLRHAGIRCLHTGRLADREYSEYLRLADLGVSLRTESRGESSAALQDQLRHGLPTIVSDIGSFREIPDTVVAKVPPGDAAQLAQCITGLRGDRNARGVLARASARWLRTRHWSRVARMYRDVLS